MHAGYRTSPRFRVARRSCLRSVFGEDVRPSGNASDQAGSPSLADEVRSVTTDPQSERTPRSVKTDLKKEIRSYTAPKGRFEIVTVPAFQFLMIDGQGDPNTAPAYGARSATLYPVAHTLKFLSKRELDRVLRRHAARGTVVVGGHGRLHDRSGQVPLELDPHDPRPGLAHLRARHHRKGGGRASKARTRPPSTCCASSSLDEGLAVQTLHVGPYDDEAPVLATMHDDYIPAQGLRMTGRHHEIYLNDPRRVAPGKLRTILRQPVAHAAT